MSNNNQFTRRSLLKTAGGLALVSGVSAPAILRAQTADVIQYRPSDAAHRLSRPARRICRDGRSTSRSKRSMPPAA